MGNLIIADDSGVFLDITFTDLAVFARSAETTSAVAETINDLGDEAYVGPAGADVPTTLAFRQGSRAVLLGSGRTEDGDATLSIEQLREIADLIASRLE